MHFCRAGHGTRFALIPLAACRCCRLKQAARCAALLEAASVLLQWGAEFEGLTPWSQLALVEAAAAVGATVVGLPVWRSATAVLRTACQVRLSCLCAAPLCLPLGCSPLWRRLLSTQACHF